MRRFEAIREIMNAVTDELVVSNIGNPSQELFSIKDRKKNFYMLGSMGLASSIGLGIAMSTGKKTVVIDGDGSVLMNLGTFATIAANKPRNYVLIIIDNQSYGSTGFQRTFTAKNVRLDDAAKSCGIRKVSTILNMRDIKKIVIPALRSKTGPHCIIIKAKKGMPEALPIIPYSSIAIKERFMKEI